MRIARILPGIAVLNGHVFVCGGEVDSQILANGEIYDPHEDTWCEMASMTIPRCEFGECVLPNVRHYKPRLVYFLTPFFTAVYIVERLVLQTI